VRHSPRLFIALSGSFLLTIVTTTVAYTRYAEGTLLSVIGKPLVFIVLSALALRRYATARWLLIAWLTIGVVHSAAYVYGETGHFRQQVLLLGVAAVEAWACVELVIDGLAGTRASRGAAA
jgi:hypothetical protein